MINFLHRNNMIYAVLLLFLYGCGESKNEQAFPMILPNVSFFTLEGEAYRMEFDKRKKLLIFFNSNCDTCRDKARFYKKFSEVDTKIQVYIISNEDILAIKQFNLEFDLDQINNITVLQDKNGVCFTQYSIITTPTILLYNSDNSFEQSFSADTPIGYIIDKLK
jgi:peroxiredoxin